MATDLYVGRRLSFEGSLCTVRYIGPLTGTKGEWLGVEWDDPSRGKHDGKHKENRVFDCLSSSPTAASFVKSTRTPDPERTVLEAIKFKYGSGSTDTTTDVVVISGKVAEEVGFDKVAREQGQLSELRIILVDQLVVNGIAPRTAAINDMLDAARELSRTCPNITELDLGWNTIEHWEHVAYICSALPKLKILRARLVPIQLSNTLADFDFSGLRLRTFAHSLNPSPFSRIKELHLAECLITPVQFCQLLSDSGRFTSLEELYLSQNQLNSLLQTGMSQVCIKNLKSLILENNLFETLDCIASANRMFPNLQSVSLQGNRVAQVGLETQEGAFSQITTLNLSQNVIASFAFIDNLPQKFPNLSSLRITDNPLLLRSEFNNVNDPRASDKSYYLTLARLPSLLTLNYAKISSRDREEGEIYYLSVAEKGLKSLFAASKDPTELVHTAKSLYPRYQKLTEKYFRDSIIDQYLASFRADEGETTNLFKDTQSAHPAGSLAARIVNATFYIPSDTSAPVPVVEVELRIPSTLPVTRLMSILLQNANFRPYVKPMCFKMIYESKELDPDDTTAEGSTKSSIYGKNLSPEEKRAIWKEWGDWDADAIVEQELHARENNNASKHQATSNERVEHWSEDGKYCIKEGRRWKRREVEIPRALKRPWGDWIDDAKTVRVRIEPFTETSE